MDKLCPYCGTPLKITNKERYFCPNHGIIEENDIDEEEIKKQYKGYIG